MIKQLMVQNMMSTQNSMDIWSIILTLCLVHCCRLPRLMTRHLFCPVYLMGAHRHAGVRRCTCNPLYSGWKIASSFHWNRLWIPVLNHHCLLYYNWCQIIAVAGNFVFFTVYMRSYWWFCYLITLKFNRDTDSTWLLQTHVREKC